MDPKRKPDWESNRPDNDTGSPFFAVSIAVVDRDITILENSLSVFPRFHSKHIDVLSTLARLRWVHYQHSREKKDLDKCIVHITSAIFLLPVSRANDIPRLLYELTVGFPFMRLIR